MSSTVKPNRIERLKAVLKPSDFLPHIAQLDLRNLTEEEQFYLKNYGIYNHKLSPEHFMLRLRVTAGKITIEQLREIAKTATIYQLKPLITMRAQIELHGLNADNVLEVWQRLDRSGITTWQTLTDNFRNIVTDPFDGVSETHRIETYPLIKEIETLFLKNPEYIGMLPRKFNTALCGNTKSSHSFFSNDLFLGLARKGDTLGFNLYLGGKNSEMAQDADIFVTQDEVVSLFRAIIKTYIDHGPRGSRSKTRLFHMLQVTGVDGFKKYLQHYYPKPLSSAGLFLIERTKPVEYTPLKNGTSAFCYRSHWGEISTESLTRLCDYAEEYGLTIRLGIDQNITLFGLKKGKTPSFSRQSTPPLLSVCAGSRYCPLSLFDMKEEAAMLPLEQLSKHNISVGYSGCLKGCGKHQHSDIGLIGLRTAIYGPTQKSVRLFLGGQYTYGKATARLILMAIPLHAINDLIMTILEDFKWSGYEEFETFSKKVLNRYSTDFLALWFLARHYTHKKLSLRMPKEEMDNSFEHSGEKKRILASFPELELRIEGEHPFHQSIKYLSQALWSEKPED